MRPILIIFLIIILINIIFSYDFFISDLNNISYSSNNLNCLAPFQNGTINSTCCSGIKPECIIDNQQSITCICLF